MERTAKIIAVVGLLVLCGSAWAVEGNEPIAHWKFDEGSGTIAYDSAGENDGTIHGAVWTAGQIDGALSFDGVDDYVACGTGPAITGTGAFTVSAWVQTDSTTGNVIINQRSPSSANGSYAVSILVDERVQFHIYNGGYGFIFQSNVTVNDGLWHHIVAVRTNSTDGEIYVDGSLAGTGSGPAKSLNNVGVNIGRAFTVPVYFNGLIDDVRIYDRALSAEEVQQLYQKGGGGLIAHWKFDESAGGTAYDSVGDNDGTVHGAVWSTGQIDGALSFDGINDYVDIGDPGDGSLDFGTADFTLSVWFKTSMSAPGFFVCKRAKGYYAGYDFYIERDGRIFARIADGSSVPGASTTERFNDGLWHHAAAVYDRDGVIRIYVDSVSKATSRSIKWIGNVNNSEPFTIGDRNDPGHHYYFDGSIDDVRIYNRALSAEEIWQLYQAAPVACILGGDRTVEAGSGCEAKITLDGSCSSDADSTPGTNDDINDFDWYDVVDVCDPNSDIFLGSGEIIECNLPLGEHDIILEVTDKACAFDTNEVTITVEDTTPPELSLTVEPSVLWPANHKMVEITSSWEVSDNCDEWPEVTLVNITINEDGATEDDIQIGDEGIWLRAERSGIGDGRIYTITYRAVDDSGNVSIESAAVTVPHDKGKR